MIRKPQRIFEQDLPLRELAKALAPFGVTGKMLSNHIESHWSSVKVDAEFLVNVDLANQLLAQVKEYGQLSAPRRKKVSELTSNDLVRLRPYSRTERDIVDALAKGKVIGKF